MWVNNLPKVATQYGIVAWLGCEPRTSRSENQRVNHYATEPVDTEATVHLVVVFDAHTERVDEDRNENSSLKVFAVDKLLQL